MHGPLSSPALRGRPEDRPSGLQIDGAGPHDFDERLRGERLSGLGVEHVEEAVFRRGHRHMTLLAVQDKVRHQNVIVLGVDALGAGLVMPNVLSGVRIHRDDAFAEEPVAGRFDEAELAVIDSDSSGAENHETRGIVIGDGVPHVAAANSPPAFAGPRFCRHFERFRFEW